MRKINAMVMAAILWAGLVSRIQGLAAVVDFSESSKDIERMVS